MHSIREALAKSHVSAVTIAILCVWSGDWLVRGLWVLLYRVAGFLFTTVAILDIPYLPWDLTQYRFVLERESYYLVYALSAFCGAYLLSRWVYGVGPLHGLSKARALLDRRSDA
jgi:hypothetical protein